MPGVDLRVQNIATNAVRTIQSNEIGRYEIVALQPGDYQITASKEGFATLLRKGVTLAVGQRAVVDLAMQVSATASTVTVDSNTSVVETDKTDVSTVVNLKDVMNLPMNGRRWDNFTLTTPGASNDGAYGLISFRGMSGLYNNNMIDGMDNNQAFFSEAKGRTRLLIRHQHGSHPGISGRHERIFGAVWPFGWRRCQRCHQVRCQPNAWRIFLYDPRRFSECRQPGGWSPIDRPGTLAEAEGPTPTVRALFGWRGQARQVVLFLELRPAKTHVPGRGDSIFIQFLDFDRHGAGVQQCGQLLPRDGRPATSRRKPVGWALQDRLERHASEPVLLHHQHSAVGFSEWHPDRSHPWISHLGQWFRRGERRDRHRPLDRRRNAHLRQRASRSVGQATSRPSFRMRQARE